MDFDLIRSDVQKDVEKHKVFVPKHAFMQSMDTIWQWIDVASLTPHLMSRGLIQTQNDLYYINDMSIPPMDRITNLVMKIAPKAGNYGTHLLYMCIRDARSHLGHSDAAKLLKERGNKFFSSASSCPPEPIPQPSHQPPVGATTTYQRTSTVERQNTTGGTKKTLEKTTVTSRTVFDNVVIEAHEAVQRQPSNDPELLARPVQESYHHDSLEPTSLPSLDGPRGRAGEKGVASSKQHAQHPGKMEARLVYEAQLCEETHAKVKELFRTNKIEEINHDMNAYDLECLPGDQVEDRFKLINHICQFVVACLNSRFSLQTGVHITGVTATSSLEKPFLYKGLKFVPDSSIADGFMKRMGQTIFERSTSDGSVRAIQPQHLHHMVRFEFISASTSSPPAGKRNPGEEYFALLTVVPNLEICASSIFFFSSVIDKNNLPRKCDVYRRLEGSSVLVQPNRVPRLEAELKEQFTKYRAAP